MATKSKLFESWQFQLPLPAPFDDVSTVAKGHSDVGSKYNRSKAPQSTLHAPTLKAILAYQALEDTDAPGAIGFQDNKLIVAEYGSNKCRAIVFDQSKGKFYAAVADAPYSILRPYTLGSRGETGSALLFALMPLFLEDDEFNEAFLEFNQYDASNDLEALTKSAALLCDNVYRRIMGAEVLGDAGISLNLPATGNITQLTELMVQEETYAPNQVLYGQFQIFKPVSPSKVTLIGNRNDFAGQFTLSDQDFSMQEQMLIPTLPDWYVLPQEVMDICMHIKETSNLGRPMRNIMLRGDSGVGKTEAAKAIATGLQIPYYALTCHPGMEIYDLVGQMLPVSDFATEDKAMGNMENELPSFTDLMMDPATVMCQLTGAEYDELITADVAFMALIEARSKEKAALQSEGTQRFRFVKSPLIIALETGALIEIQEPTLINDPGVLAGLNSLMDNGQMITLPTGELIKRDPQSVIVMTTNVGYAGCGTLNQAVISRLQIIINMKEPSFDDVVQRVLQVTKCSDLEMVETMTKVFFDMKMHCREKIIQDGSIGIRELIDWVESYMVTHNAYQSALYTIIPSASMDEENWQELIDVCLAPKIYDKSNAR